MSGTLELWSVGHSTRELAAFLDLLRTHRIEAVADIRRYPASRRLPHFGAKVLEAALSESGVAYVWMPALGGRRRLTPGAPGQPGAVGRRDAELRAGVAGRVIARHHAPRSPPTAEERR